jgi:hypothetical protein
MFVAFGPNFATTSKTQRGAVAQSRSFAEQGEFFILLYFL